MRFTRPGASARMSGAWPKRSAKGFSSRKLHLHGPQLLDLFFRQGVRRERAGAELAAGQVLEAPRHAVSGVELDVQMRLRMRLAVGGRLVEDHDVGEGLAPQAVVLEEHGLQGAGEVGALG